jgi:hypothetical protein
MASLKHLEKRKAAQLDRIERKLDLLLKASGMSLEETEPVQEEPTGEGKDANPEAGDPEGEQPEAGEAEDAKPRNRKNK